MINPEIQTSLIDQLQTLLPENELLQSLDNNGKIMKKDLNQLVKDINEKLKEEDLTEVDATTLNSAKKHLTYLRNNRIGEDINTSDIKDILSASNEQTIFFEILKDIPSATKLSTQNKEAIFYKKELTELITSTKTIIKTNEDLSEEYKDILNLMLTGLTKFETAQKGKTVTIGQTRNALITELPYKALNNEDKPEDKSDYLRGDLATKELVELYIKAVLDVMNKTNTKISDFVGKLSQKVANIEQTVNNLTAPQMTQQEASDFVRSQMNPSKETYTWD